MKRWLSLSSVSAGALGMTNGMILGSMLSLCIGSRLRMSCVKSSLLSLKKLVKKSRISFVALFGVPFWRPPVFCPFMMLALV